MLLGIHVKNMALIREEEVELGPGLNILTGETGAGKSILIGAVNVALGNGNFRDFVPENENYALVELTFETGRETVLEKMRELDIPDGDGLITLSRRWQSGRSVNRINGETVSLAALRQVAAELIDIHGQSENQSLLYPKNHLRILDSFAHRELGDLPDNCARAFSELKAAQKELKEALAASGDRSRRADLLAYEIGEITDAALKEGEDEELEQRFRLLSSGQKIVETLSAVRNLVSGDEGAGEQIGPAVRRMMDIGGLDERIDSLSGELSEIEQMLDDFARGLADYMDDFSYDEEEFAAVGERLDLINRLKAKYGRTIGDILAYRDERQAQLEQLENYDAYVQGLEKKAQQAEKAYFAAAEKITKIRREAAPRLAALMQESMRDLNFPSVRFSIEISALEEPSASGMDSAAFLISLNEGVSLRPMQDVASGGELSRIMLAIKAVMADQDQTDALIFDEIDTGISGRTAQKVSEKMALIAASRQVICITHLAQIAAMADRHMLIEKTVEEGITRTHIRPLDEQESREELARILGGAEITSTVLGSAAEMKTMAEKIKETCRKKSRKE